MPDSDYIVSNNETLSSRTGDRMWKVPSGVTCYLPSGSIVEIKAGLIVVEGTINGVGKGEPGGGGGASSSSGSPGSGPGGGGGGAGGGYGGGGGGYGWYGGEGGGAGGGNGGNLYGNPTDSSVYLGSGGGGGGGGTTVSGSNGGPGGGGIGLYAPYVIVSGTVNVSGSAGFNNSSSGGGGGGGSGGTIMIEAHRAVLSGSTLQAMGGNGGTSG
ncbi:MAG: hypothetical protein QW815_03090 [Nitrososphaerota archaeon]